MRFKCRITRPHKILFYGKVHPIARPADADTDVEVNVDKHPKQWPRWILPSPLVMARAPKCVLAPGQPLQTQDVAGAQFETQFAYLTASIPYLPGIAFQDIQNA